MSIFSAAEAADLSHSQAVKARGGRGLDVNNSWPRGV
jgi:hypothetical protein